MSVHWAPEETVSANWRTKLCALVDQERTTFVLERDIFRRGRAELAPTVTELFAVLFPATRSATLLETPTLLVKTPSTVGLTTTMAVVAAPLARVVVVKVITPFV